MKGLYSGVTMKLRYIWPKGFQNKIVSLSHEAQVRLSWVDWYLSMVKTEGQPIGILVFPRILFIFGKEGLILVISLL